MEFIVKFSFVSIVFIFILISSFLTDESRAMEAVSLEVLEGSSMKYTNKSIKVGMVETSYLDEGADKKETILLLHGFSFKVGFTSLIDELSKEARVISPDLPGFGLTITEKQDYLVNDYLLFINDFLDELKIDKVSVFGNSMGGTLALRFAEKYPEKVEKVIVRSPLVNSDQLPWYAKNKIMISIYRILSSNDNILLYFSNIFFGQFTKLTTKGIYDQDTLDEIHKQQRNISLKNARSILFDLANTNITDSILTNVSQPTLILWGEQDGLLDYSWADKIAEKMPNSFINIKANQYHNILTVNAVDLSSDILEFIKK